MLQTSGVPGDLVREWIGHSSLRMTTRYTHFDESFRKLTAKETGLFVVGPNGPNLEQPLEESTTA